MKSISKPKSKMRVAAIQRRAVFRSCGDILLYNDSNIVIMIGNNSWSYTKLGHIENASRESLIAALGEGDVEVALTI